MKVKINHLKVQKLKKQRETKIVTNLLKFILTFAFGNIFTTLKLKGSSYKIYEMELKTKFKFFVSLLTNTNDRRLGLNQYMMSLLSNFFQTTIVPSSNLITSSNHPP